MYLKEIWHFYSEILHFHFIFVHSSQGHESEMSHPDKQSFDPMFQATSPSQIPSYSRDFDQGYNPDPSTQMSRDGISGQGTTELLYAFYTV